MLEEEGALGWDGEGATSHGEAAPSVLSQAGCRLCCHRPCRAGVGRRNPVINSQMNSSSLGRELFVYSCLVK